jgi:hypothetical protein
MTVETDLQNAVAAASALNQTVQAKIDAINSTVDSAIDNNDSRTSTAINGMTDSVNAELANIRPYSTNYLFWNTLAPSDRIRIFPAMTIGHPWADGSRVNASDDDKNPIVWDNYAGGYRPDDSINRNPFIEWGAIDEWNAQTEGDQGTGYGSAYAPVLMDPTNGQPLTFTNSSGQTDYYRCYADFSTDGVPVWAARRLQPFDDLHSISGRKAYLVMSGSVVGHPDRAARTFVNVGKTSNGSYSSTHSYQRQDLNGDGIVESTVRNWARPRMARHSSADTYCGNPDAGDSPSSTGLIAVQGQHYNTTAGHRNFSNATTEELAANPTIVPAPYTDTPTNNYQAVWAIPVGDLATFSNVRWRVYNWGFTGLIVEGWGLAYMTPVTR